MLGLTLTAYLIDRRSGRDHERAIDRWNPIRIHDRGLAASSGGGHGSTVYSAGNGSCAVSDANCELQLERRPARQFQWDQLGE